MTETKIPMQIFTSYEALTQYYGDRDDCELGLYVSDNELLVGHVPTAYSFNPQYFTGYNELLPDYAPPSVIDYTVTAESNNSTYGYVTGAGTYPQHSEITLNAYAYNGYKFDKWSNDVETAAYTFAVEENVDLTAIFVDNTYTVTLKQSSPHGTLTGAGTYIANSLVTVTATPDEGYYVSGWINETTHQPASNNSEYTFTLVEDTTLRAGYAKYKTVSATPNNTDYGSTTGSGNQYKLNDSVTVTATANTGYRFVNWTEDNVEVSTSSSYTFTMDINDVTLIANFEPATANINISANNPTYGSVDAAGSTIIGDNYTVMAEANTGYVFVNWTEGGVEVSTSANYTFTVAGDRTLVANFEENPLAEPFYVENINSANETLSIVQGSGAPIALTIEYSSDKTNWSTLGTTSTTALTRTIAPGEKLYLRCNTNYWCKYVSWQSNPYNPNHIKGVSKVGGNIMSLLYGANFTGNETAFKDQTGYTFYQLFDSDTVLQNAEKLILPVADVQGCYYNMFTGCTSLTTAPSILPATTLAQMCYFGIFNGCTSLTTAPSILPATTLAQMCYSRMFNGCTSLTTPPALPATTLAAYCYRYMFMGCTSLTTPPALPATTLVEGCYEQMLDGCTSLITAPDLLVTRATGCRYMFNGCTNLNYVKCLAATINTNGIENWLQNVSATGTFVKAAGVEWPTGVSGIPSGWTVVEEAVS